MEGLRDETLVVRGGLMEVASLRGSIRVAMVEEGYPNLCFWGDNGLETLEDVVSVAFLPHGRVRTSTVGKVRG